MKISNLIVACGLLTFGISVFAGEAVGWKVTCKGDGYVIKATQDDDDIALSVYQNRKKVTDELGEVNSYDSDTQILIFTGPNITLSVNRSTSTATKGTGRLQKSPTGEAEGLICSIRTVSGS